MRFRFPDSLVNIAHFRKSRAQSETPTSPAGATARPVAAAHNPHRPVLGVIPSSQRRSSQSSDNCAEYSSNTGGNGERQCPPKCHSNGSSQDVRATRFCPDCSQKRKKSQRRSRYNWNQQARRRNNDHKQRHSRAYGKHDCGRERCLHRPGCRDFGNPEFIARMCRQGVFGPSTWRRPQVPRHPLLRRRSWSRPRRQPRQSSSPSR
jgi:hypothetical protein